MPETGPTKRSVIIHADDIGMCEASVSALPEVMLSGLVSSASLMAPCPWFPAAAKWFREHPEMDAGVHITLTSEWLDYRWRPVSTLDRASGLLDAEGFMPRSTDELQELARPDAVLTEARGQMELVRRYGIEPSHIDAHMFAFSRLFASEYTKLGVEFALPILRQPPFACIVGTPNPEECPEGHVAAVMDLFTNLPPGLSCVFLHPSCDTPELRSIVPKWRHRVADWKTFQDRRLKDHIEMLGISVLTYRDLAVQHPSSIAAKG